MAAPRLESHGPGGDRGEIHWEMVLLKTYMTCVHIINGEVDWEYVFHFSNMLGNMCFFPENDWEYEFFFQK